MSEQASSHDVGRGKPPRGSRFKPGKSGNPKGRPKGSKNFVTLIFELANELVPAKDGTMTRLEMMLRDLIDAALDGSAKQVISVTQLMQDMDWADEPEGLSAQTFGVMYSAAYKQMQIETEKSLAAARVKWKEEAEGPAGEGESGEGLRRKGRGDQESRGLGGGWEEGGRLAGSLFQSPPFQFLSLRSLSLYFLDESSKNGSLTTASAGVVSNENRGCWIGLFDCFDLIKAKSTA